MNEKECALQECKAQQQAVLDGSSDMIALLDKNRQVVWANKSLQKIHSAPEGKSCRELFCGKEGECQGCVIAKSFGDDSEYSCGQDTAIVRRDNEDLFLKITCSPVREQKSGIDKVVVIAQDITEKLRLEKQLKHASKMEAIGTLAGGIAHDFNNILTPIMGYSEIMRLSIMQETADREESIYYIDQIIVASRRAHRLVQQILAFSRSGEAKESQQAVHPILKEGMKLIQATMPSSIKVETVIDENCGLVSVDPVEIHQVLINLCTNAADAMAGKNGTLKVILRQLEDPGGKKKWVELLVSDTGCGISQDGQERIFDPYFTTKEKVQGTGMGLAVVHGIVNRRGGKIRVQSVLGSGTAISIKLPVVEQVNDYVKFTTVAECKGAGQHIMLVDDEKQVVSATAEMLRRFGYLVTEMTSAREALLVFREDQDEFDLVITDLTMPYMNGIELCGKMKEIRPQLPVLLYSGAMEEYSQASAIQAGVDGFCLKPLTMSEMAKTIYQLLL